MIVNQDVKYSNLTFKNANVKQVVDKILADANNSSDTQDLSFSITPDHIKAEMTPWSTEYRQAGPLLLKQTVTERSNQKLLMPLVK